MMTCTVGPSVVKEELTMLWFMFELGAVLTVLVTILCLVIILLSDADILTLLWERFGSKPESLAGKVVWITGASSGIGEYLAYQLSQVGCKLIISARREEQLQRVKDACLSSGKCRTKADDILVLPLDVAQCDTHKVAVQTVLDRFKHIDVLLNNAGRGLRAKWWDVDLSVDRELFELNVLGTVSLTQCVLPSMMSRRQGHVAVVSSIAGFLSGPRSRAYTGAKHAVQGYFAVLRNEIRDYNLDVTLICPGPVHSDFDVNQLTATGEQLKESGNRNRMSTERCAYLSCVAIANRMYETWITPNPALIICYLHQYFPNFTSWFFWRFALGIQVSLEGQDH